MQNDSLIPAQIPVSDEAKTARYAGPIWTLVVLAPVIAEVLSGSTRLSFIFALVPEIMVWGCGALLCRELVRRWRAGGTSLLLLGLALSIVEEFVVQQTSLAPLPFPGANVNYGRIWGVNWLYFLFMLGFESVWVVLVPIEITELIFPSRRSQRWLRRRGFLATCVIFLIGCYIAWFAWMRRALPMKFHLAPYRPPFTAIASGVTAIVLLGWAAYALRRIGHGNRSDSATPVNPWLIGIVAFVMGCAWFKLIGLVFNRTRYPFWMPMTAGCVWALIAFVFFLRWSTVSQWGDSQRWSAAFGATLASMSVGYLSTAGWSRVDLAGKVVFNLLALIGLLLLAVKIRRRAARESAG